MNIKFLGATKTVTGSCFLISTEKHRFIVDCGLFQGFAEDNELNEKPFQFTPSEIDFMLLTHAHIDHSGRIPKLFVDGFKGEIFATKPTVELCGIMLPDSGHIQEIEVEWKNRKRQRSNKPLLKPIYTFQDAIDCQKLFKPIKYNETVEINDEISFRFNDAGHILGSAIIEVWIKEEGKSTKIVFSGDLGNKDTPLLRDRTNIESADYLIVESTYGNRIHNDFTGRLEKFVDIIIDTIENNGNVIIPSFAVGRTQEIIYGLNKKRMDFNEKFEKFIKIPVFIDSPLAISATKIFENNLDCFDEETKQYISSGDNPLDFPGLEFTKTSDESKALNFRKNSSIIISASGMCDAGRIKHHLKHNLWRKDSSVIFIGYQANGTLGRRLVDGVKKVRIFGEDISVNARIEMIDGFSGHADMDGLLDWIGKFNKKPEKIFIVHGEETAMEDFADSIKQKFNIDTLIPNFGDSYIIKAKELSEELVVHSIKKAERKHETIDKIDSLITKFSDISEMIKNNYSETEDENKREIIDHKLKEIEKIVSELPK